MLMKRLNIAMGKLWKYFSRAASSSMLMVLAGSMW